MIQNGNTVVIRDENGSLNFYWICDIRPNEYVLFDWFGDLRRATLADFRVISKKRFAEGKGVSIEVYDSLPEKYLDVFEQQARKRNG